MKDKSLNKICKHISLSILCVISLNATTLRDTVENTINTNPDIIAEHYNKKVFRTNIEEQQRDYYPTLDFEIYVEDSTTHNQPDNVPPAKGWADKDGWNAALKFEQVLYDGGQTPNEIEQYKHRYYNIKYTSNEKVEDIISDVISSYLDLLLNQSLIAIDEVKLEAHDKYLTMAIKKEEFDGTILDKLQVQSKITAIMDNYLEQIVKRQKSFSTYQKLSGKKIFGEICKPIINENLLPKTIEEAIEKALRSDNSIRAQKELIQEQRALLLVKEAKFRPDLKFQVQGQWDDDLALPENGRQDIYRVRLQSSWNLYEGGKDTVAYQREKIAMLEQRKVLDAIKNDVIDGIKGTYNTYFQMKKRIQNIEKFVSLNDQIVRVYQEQVKDGSRTFVDLLDAETELFRTRILLVEEIFNMYKEYFNILRNLNKLSDTILTQKNQVCKAFDITTIIPDYNDMFKPNVDENKEETLLEEELGLEG